MGMEGLQSTIQQGKAKSNFGVGFGFEGLFFIGVGGSLRWSRVFIDVYDVRLKDSFQDLCAEKNSGVFYLISVYSSSSIAGKRELQDDLIALNNGNEK
ncbi:transmembrane protein, putative [Medicago truncatula]|uniref:Transmembrane protein, putative n=1 Tax=Medicago truncatula TaxID=3880 RepID=G7KXB9_MEDTR|nr:transmembrane protein, putative [Medicago truncatula]